MSTQHDGGDAFRNKYAGKYLPPDVKNWSDQNEVRDAFKDKYASSSVNLNAVGSKQYDGLNALKSSKSSNDASSQLSDLRSDVSAFSASAPPVSLAVSGNSRETHAGTAVTALSNAADAHAAIEMASAPQQGKRGTPLASLTLLIIAGIAATSFVAKIYIMPSAGKTHQNPVFEPL